MLAEALDEANSQFLLNNKSPSRKVGELDNRGSHYYLALYWANALAEQSSDPELQAQFLSVAKKLQSSESTIIEELNASQGASVDIGGYYHPDAALSAAAMRPSATFNAIIDNIA